MNKITVSIVVYENEVEALKKTIDSCLNSFPEVLIYVIDNSSTDETRSICTDYRIVYIFNGSNIGFGRAHNIAIKKILKESKYHLVLNPDVYFDKAVIPELLDFMESEENVGVVSPKILYPNGKLQYLCKLLPTPLHLISRRFFKGLNNDLNYNYEMRFTGYQTIMDVPFISGCFMFIRTSAFLKAGLFDERIFLYTEDIDLSRRINKYYRTVFYPYSYIYHEHSRESYKKSIYLWHHINSAIKYFNKWGWFSDEERDRINNKIKVNSLNYNKWI